MTHRVASVISRHGDGRLQPAVTSLVGFKASMSGLGVPRCVTAAVRWMRERYHDLPLNRIYRLLLGGGRGAWPDRQQ